MHPWRSGSSHVTLPAAPHHGEAFAAGNPVPPQRLNPRVTAFSHNVRHVREIPACIAPGRSGTHRFRHDRKRPPIPHGPARAHPNAQGTGPQHARHNLRDGNPDYARGFVVHGLLALLPMTRAGPIIVAVIAALLSSPLSAREYRSREVTREFQREHPCPSTGKTSGACPGYRKDHIKPLACGGSDAVSNMQWQTVAAARAKDRWELRACGR